MKSALVLSMLYNYIDVTGAGCLVLPAPFTHSSQKGVLFAAHAPEPEPVVNHKLYKLWKQLSKRVHHSLAEF